MLLGRPSVLISLLLAQCARRSSEYASECSSSSAYTHCILTPGLLAIGGLPEAALEIGERIGRYYGHALN